MKSTARCLLLACVLAGTAGPLAAQEDAPEAPRFSDAEIAAHVEQLRERLPWEGFSIVVQKPFVVVGDEAPGRVRARAAGTIKWAVDRLKAQYFTKDPLAIIDVWLFKDKRSYERGVQKLFGERPSTPFGYYSPHHQALVMNIATGGGTLVHELVHPFVAANFPGCPSWFNEGLASLYEQCRDVEGKITGLTNWRLTGLQEAIREDRLPPVSKLLGTGQRFYTADRGTNYAQARYLCYYLQERGLLEDFYRRFLRTHGDDPTGAAALSAVLETKDLDAFERETWRPFVQKLRFR